MGKQVNLNIAQNVLAGARHSKEEQSGKRGDCCKDCNGKQYELSKAGNCAIGGHLFQLGGINKDMLPTKPVRHFCASGKLRQICAVPAAAGCTGSCLLRKGGSAKCASYWFCNVAVNSLAHQLWR